MIEAPGLQPSGLSVPRVVVPKVRVEDKCPLLSFRIWQPPLSIPNPVSIVPVVPYRHVWSLIVLKVEEVSVSLSEALFSCLGGTPDVVSAKHPLTKEA